MSNQSWEQHLAVPFIFIGDSRMFNVYVEKEKDTSYPKQYYLFKMWGDKGVLVAAASGKSFIMSWINRTLIGDNPSLTTDFELKKSAYRVPTVPDENGLEFLGQFDTWEAAMGYLDMLALVEGRDKWDS